MNSIYEIIFFRFVTISITNKPDEI